MYNDGQEISVCFFLEWEEADGVDGRVIGWCWISFMFAIKFVDQLLFESSEGFLNEFIVHNNDK